MTHVLLSLLIVATAAPAPTGQRHPEAVTLFECGFEEKSDTNFDQWPDHWTRRRGKYSDLMGFLISGAMFPAPCFRCPFHQDRENPIPAQYPLSPSMGPVASAEIRRRIFPWSVYWISSCSGPSVGNKINVSPFVNRSAAGRARHILTLEHDGQFETMDPRRFRGIVQHQRLGKRILRDQFPGTYDHVPRWGGRPRGTSGGRRW